MPILKLGGANRSDPLLAMMIPSSRFLRRGRDIYSMNHFATPDFWYAYRNLPASARELADKSFVLLQHDPHHSSLRLKKIGSFWSARVGLHYRALARDRADGLVWFWIGHHNEYDLLLKR